VGFAPAGVGLGFGEPPVAGVGDGCVFAFCGVPFGVGDGRPAAFAFAGTGHKKIPLGCIMHSGGMNWLLPPFGMVTYPPPEPIGAPAGGFPPFAHGS